LGLRLKRVKTRGDIFRHVALARVNGKGIFVKEIEEALLSGEIDLAVHSLKDLPTALPRGLAIGAVPPREDPRDALVSALGIELGDLSPGAVVGTGSLRRMAQLLAARSDLEVREIRGNVDTRLRKVREGEYDAVILAAAGLRRLGLASAITQYLPLEVMMPAVGQGALAVEIRQDDQEMATLVRGINDPATEAATQAERAFLAAFGGGCAVPIAAYGAGEGERLLLKGMVTSLDGQRLLRDEVVGPVRDPQALGQMLAQRLLERGADEIVSEVIVGR
jgi:hydroxymethylbilane synthase